MGIGASLELWEPLEAILTRGGIQTITFDLPGSGQSPAPLSPRRMPALARLTAGVVEALGYPRVDVLGVSYGGVVAQQLAHRAPSRVRRLILAATAPGFGGIPGHPRVLLRLATPLRYWSPSYARRIAREIYGGGAGRMDCGLASPVVALQAHPPSLHGYLTQLYAIAGWTSLPWLHRIPHETLVLAGDDDPIIPLANARILTARIRHASLVIIPGGGHLFLLERAGESARHIRCFLSE